MSNQTAVFIVLLRGINVSGQKKMKMADLCLYLEELHFRNIQTYIQSGNIIFQYEETSKKDLKKMIEDKITEKYGFHVPAIVITPSDLRFALNNNPFIRNRQEDSDRCYITFLSDIPTRKLVNEIDIHAYYPEEFIVKEKTIFFYSPNAYGKAKMNNNFFEQKLRIQATTRNWKTINKLYEFSGFRLRQGWNY